MKVWLFPHREGGGSPTEEHIYRQKGLPAEESEAVPPWNHGGKGKAQHCNGITVVIRNVVIALTADTIVRICGTQRYVKMWLFSAYRTLLPITGNKQASSPHQDRLNCYRQMFNFLQAKQPALIPAVWSRQPNQEHRRHLTAWGTSPTKPEALSFTSLGKHQTTKSHTPSPTLSGPEQETRVPQPEAYWILQEKLNSVSQITFPGGAWRSVGP